MFNLNFKKLLFNGIWNAGQAGTGCPQFENPTNVIDINGSTKQIGSLSDITEAEYIFNSLIHALNRIAKNAGGANIGQSYFKLGTGTTTPAEDDYNIETEASDLVINQVTQTTTATFGKAYNLNITNTGSSAITLSEVVQVLKLLYNKYNNTAVEVAISRTAVSVSFAPGETKTIMVEVSI